MNKSKILKILEGVAVFVFFYLLLATVMFLGLQVKPLYGTVGLIVFAGLLLTYLMYKMRDT